MTFNYFTFLLQGAALTVIVAIFAAILGMSAGLIAALARLAPWAPIRWIGVSYVNVFRSTPLFIQLVWLFYALPILTGISADAIVTGILGLGLYEGAYFAENFRTGVLAVPVGQREAAQSQGMSTLQAYRWVILPQAVRLMLPPTASTLVSLVKDSSIVSVIGVADLLFQASALAAYTLRPLEILTVSGLMYICLAYPLTLVANLLHRRYLVYA